METLAHTIATEEDINYVIGLLSLIYPVSDKLAAAYNGHTMQFNLQKGEHIVLPGGICKHMYFIKSGAMMGYVPNGNTNITTYISIENEFISSLSGLYGNQPSREAIVAIEDTVLLGVHTDVLLGFYEEFFELNYIIRIIYEEYYRDAQERSYIIRVGNAKERYQYFLGSRKGDVAKLPIDCVASFLNMKPATLIKIKNELENELSAHESRLLILEVIEYLLLNQSFKDSKITAKSFAFQNNISEKKLRTCISRNLKTNFKDFINGYRIAHFKEMLTNEKNLKNLTIDAIATISGFSSRSSFYLASKKQAGKFLKKSYIFHKG